MQKSLSESGNFALRHELDRLAADAAAITSSCAPHAQSDRCWRQMANGRKSRSSMRRQPALSRFLRDDPEVASCLSAPTGELLGAIAFLYLNCRGHDALLLDEIDLKHPTPRLCSPGRARRCRRSMSGRLPATDAPSAGFGNVAAHLRAPRFVNADYFAQPSSDGRTRSADRAGLRAESRASSPTSGATSGPGIGSRRSCRHRVSQPGSFADARH